MKSGGKSASQKLHGNMQWHSSVRVRRPETWKTKMYHNLVLLSRFRKGKWWVVDPTLPRRRPVCSALFLRQEIISQDTLDILSHLQFIFRSRSNELSVFSVQDWTCALSHRQPPYRSISENVFFVRDIGQFQRPLLWSSFDGIVKWKWVQYPVCRAQGNDKFQVVWCSRSDVTRTKNCWECCD